MNNAVFNRRSFAAVTALTTASVIAPALWAQTRLEKTKVSIAVGGKSSFCHLPLTIADQLGYFKAEGLDVEITDFEGSSRAIQAVSGGTADIVAGAYEQTLRLQVMGQRYQAFFLQCRAPAISMGISHRSMPHYSGLADLKGKVIGVSTPGSSTNMVADLVLYRAGLRPGDVSFVGVGMAEDALTAFRTGQIDALSNVDPVMTILEQKGEIRFVADTRTLKGTLDVFGGPMPAACLFAPVEFILKNPNTVQALSDAMAHGLKWLQTAGPLDIIRTVPHAFLRGDRALYLAAFNKVREAISPDGLIADEAPVNVARVLASLDPTIRIEKIELAKTYTNTFAKQAKGRFKA